MNTFTILSFLLVVSFASAQVGIGTTTVRGDGLIDFKYPAQKGIVLPKNTTTNNSGAIGGAMIYNEATKQVEYFNDNPQVNTWVALSSPSTNRSRPNTVVRAAADDVAVVRGSETIISNQALPSTQNNAALELYSNNTALILPTVLTSNDLPTGEAGMICYIEDIKTMAVFNGTEWSFWNY